MAASLAGEMMGLAALVTERLRRRPVLVALAVGFLTAAFFADAPARSAINPNTAVTSAARSAASGQLVTLSASGSSLALTTCDIAASASGTASLTGAITWAYNASTSCTQQMSSITVKVWMVDNGTNGDGTTGSCSSCMSAFAGTTNTWPTAAGTWYVGGDTTISDPGLGLLYDLGLASASATSGTLSCSAPDLNTVHCDFSGERQTIS